MKKIFLAIIILIMIIYAPNFIWLIRSTAYISNKSAKVFNLVSVHVDGKNIQLGRLMPGESRFMFLPKSGDETFEIRYLKDGNFLVGCRQYYESAMYNIKVVINNTNSPVCIAKLAFTNELFILIILNQIN